MGLNIIIKGGEDENLRKELLHKISEMTSASIQHSLATGIFQRLNPQEIWDKIRKYAVENAGSLIQTFTQEQYDAGMHLKMLDLALTEYVTTLKKKMEDASWEDFGKQIAAGRNPLA